MKNSPAQNREAFYAVIAKHLPKQSRVQIAMLITQFMGALVYFASLSRLRGEDACFEKFSDAEYVIKVLSGHLRPKRGQEIIDNLYGRLMNRRFASRMAAGAGLGGLGVSPGAHRGDRNRLPNATAVSRRRPLGSRWPSVMRGRGRSTKPSASCADHCTTRPFPGTISRGGVGAVLPHFDWIKSQFYQDNVNSGASGFGGHQRFSPRNRFPIFQLTQPLFCWHAGLVPRFGLLNLAVKSTRRN